MDKKNYVSDKYSKDYYFFSYKFVRDMSLGYVYLTKFDLEIIDTVYFQRLKDIRQLTCRQVYPSAIHTRFEHSLGVMELTRRVMKSINTNGFISKRSNNIIFDEQIQFNAAIAALLHDVGHCPMSHLGESEFNQDEIQVELFNCITDDETLKESKLSLEIGNNPKNLKGAAHEQNSCIVILKKFSKIFSDVEDRKIECASSQKGYLFVDTEFVIRCILGMPYIPSKSDEVKLYNEKNIVIGLINSKVFDMDKLDYIMRDSFFTGIGVPQIDVDRLFKNIYLREYPQYEVVFLSKAVPVLQNMIESRDSLYMYVYNHHTVVYTDFILSYIFRRLAHNEQDFLDMMLHFARDNYMKKTKVKSIPSEYEENIKEALNTGYDPVIHLGIVSKEYLFSVDSIIEQSRSDSDLLSLLNILRYDLEKKMDSSSFKEDFILYLFGEVENQCRTAGISYSSFKSWSKNNQKYIERLFNNICRIYNLIENYSFRKYLKPWWKTNSEFESFKDIMRLNLGSHECETLCNWICNGEKDNVKWDEICSQIAKNVCFITRCLYNDDTINNDTINLLEPLNNDEFFVIRRSTHFFELSAIKDLKIAQKKNEVLGAPANVETVSDAYYIKPLTDVLPQRDYNKSFEKNSFYIFSKPLSETVVETVGLNKCEKHYELIKDIFIFVAKELVSDGILTFKENYCVFDSTESKKSEDEAHEKMYSLFRQNLLNNFE